MGFLIIQAVIVWTEIFFRCPLTVAVNPIIVFAHHSLWTCFRGTLAQWYKTTYFWFFRDMAATFCTVYLQIGVTGWDKNNGQSTILNYVRGQFFSWHPVEYLRLYFLINFLLKDLTRSLFYP